MRGARIAPGHSALIVRGQAAAQYLPSSLELGARLNYTHPPIVKLEESAHIGRKRFQMARDEGFAAF